MTKLVVVRGEFKGKPMIYIYNNQEDADAAAKGVRVFPAFSCGIAKGQHIINHITDIYKFVVDEGEFQIDWLDTEYAELKKLINDKE